MEKLTEKAIEWRDAMYGDTLEEVKEFFPNHSERNIIHALNVVSKQSEECGEIDPVDIFLKGMTYQKHISKHNIQKESK